MKFGAGQVLTHRIDTDHYVTFLMHGKIVSIGYGSKRGE